MKLSVRSLLLTGVLVVAANGVVASQVNNEWLEHWYQAKYGRNSPMEEARKRAARENATFRMEAAPKPARPANDWYERWYKAKFGVSSPMEETRQRITRANAARPEASAPRAARIANDWYEGWYRAKFGRSSPLEEARQKAAAAR